MFTLLRLAFLYLVFGAGILFVQLNNTPCAYPLVLDDGGPPFGPPIDLTRLGMDRAYQIRVGKTVLFWLPRMIDLVGIRGVPFPNYLFGRDCVGESSKPAAPLRQEPQPGPAASARPAPPPGMHPLPPARPRP